ncbi:TetR/AcrR family transcriptional regulator [Sphingoaurantiacus capsulatus]|uniref:TetR/AcrR family transcriptional regulator n=1 Tax=Sphingoaurantiacus capsulatus TaxID=1771310 RepID=A0ABV7X5D7_9SPHN
MNQVADIEKVDGRHARSHSSRRRIVEAMRQLIEQGDLVPSAARVAELAGVGQRTVFRHFDDMDTLYREISAGVEEQVMPIVAAPYAASDWRANVRDMVGRRAKVLEAMLPFRLAADVKRYGSPFLTAQQEQVLAMERALLLRLLPVPVQTERDSVEALCVTLSFQTWRALRRDQNLSAEDAARVVSHMAEALLAKMPG